MNLVAITALAYRVIFGERVPVPHLVYRQNSGALAKRADILQRRKDRLAYEPGTVFYSPERLHKGLVRLKRNDLRFFPHRRNTDLSKHK